MEPDLIYLDHSATTPIHPEVLEAMLPFLTKHHGNPGSLHRFGRTTRRAIDRAREQLATLIGATPEEICFTSSGTEANNMLLSGLRRRSRSPSEDMICSTIEHHSVIDVIQDRRLSNCRSHLELIPVTAEGIANESGLRHQLGSHLRLVSLMFANNETGALQPVTKVGQLCHDREILFHSDAVQALGKIEIDTRLLPVDAMTFSAHKIRGPKGIGAAYIRRGIPLHPLLQGGSQERNQRAGTENVPGIVGFGKACEMAQTQLLSGWNRIQELRDQLANGLLQTIPATWINGGKTDRLPNILNAGFEGLEGEAIMMALDAEGIAVGTGSACSSGSVDPSHVLLAMGQSHRQAHAAIRFSLGLTTTAQEIDRTLAILPPLIARLRNGNPS